MDGRRNFTGPRINLDDLANGATVGIPIAGTESRASGTNGYAKFADEDDLPVGIFGRGEFEDQVYDPRKRVNHNRPKKP